MRLSDEAKQPVRLRDFWLTVGAVIVLLSVICAYSVPLQQSSAVRWYWGAFLLCIWSVYLWQWVRFGRRIITWYRLIMLLWITLSSVQHFWSHAPPTWDWATLDGTILLLLVGALAPHFSGNKPQEKTINSQDAF